MRTLHLDMDGVLVDMNRCVLERTGHLWGDMSSTKMWKLIRKHAPDLFIASRPLPDAHILVDGVLRFADDHNMVVEILTAIPRLETFPGAVEQKCAWLAEHFPELAVKKFKTGPFATDKYTHAVIGDILIDDSRLNIRDWGRVGGIAIHHESAEESLSRLASVGWRRMKLWG